MIQLVYRSQTFDCEDCGQLVLIIHDTLVNEDDEREHDCPDNPYFEEDEGTDR